MQRDAEHILIEERDGMARMKEGQPPSVLADLKQSSSEYLATDECLTEQPATTQEAFQTLSGVRDLNNKSDKEADSRAKEARKLSKVKEL